MKITKLAPVTVLAVALTITSCGSDGTPENNAKIPGASDEKTEAPNSPDPNKSSQDLPEWDVSDFKLPKDIKVIIDSEKTGNIEKDQILQQHSEALVARQRILVDLDPKSRFLTRYYTDEARLFYTQEIEKAKKEKRTITGTYEYTDRVVQEYNSDRATITYCEDRSKAFAKNTDTGAIKKSKPGPKDHIATRAVLRKTAHGTWVIESFRGQSGAAKCQ